MRRKAAMRREERAGGILGAFSPRALSISGISSGVHGNVFAVISPNLQHWPRQLII
jgi:hypothetical protein